MARLRSAWFGPQPRTSLVKFGRAHQKQQGNSYPKYVLSPERAMEPRPGLRDLILYVNSEHIVRVLAPEYRDPAISSLRQQGYYTFFAGTAAPVGIAVHGGYNASTLLDSGSFGGKPIVEHELTEDEKETIRTIFRLARERGMTLHLVDVGKESWLRKLIEVHLHHLREFPVLVRPDGQRLEGVPKWSVQQIESFLSK